MKATQLAEQHEQNGTRAHNGKTISAVNSERVTTLPDAPDELWPTGKKRWEVQGAAMIVAGVLVMRDLPVLQDHCELFQQKQAWLSAIGKIVAKNGGDMPLDSDEVARANMQLSKLNGPFNVTCDFLGIGALQRTKRANRAKKDGSGGVPIQASKPIPTKWRK